MQSCHGAIYGGSGYYSGREVSFEPESCHHSLTDTANASSYPCNSNLIRLLVTEAPESFPTVRKARMEDSDHNKASCSDTNDGEVEVQVRVECADQEEANTATGNRLGIPLDSNRLAAHHSPTGSSVSSDSVGSPTPTPSFGGQTSWASSEKTVEDLMTSLRGEEVALLDGQQELTAETEQGMYNIIDLCGKYCVLCVGEEKS